MTDFETNEIGTEQALREALELLDIEVNGSPVEAWKSNGWRKKVKYEPSTNSLQLDDLEGRK